ncbi:histidine kinase [Patulibacter sp. NPDC049589]|uniref:sensor histidine kinase n=1 Tax=Patulibacter sp. NPDC049589 TaxID=3154731 RepID=UPI00342073CE
MAAERPDPRLVLLALALLGWGLLEALTLAGSGPVAARIAFVVLLFGPLVLAGRRPLLVAVVLLAGLLVNCAEQLLSNAEAVTPLQGIVIVGWLAGASGGTLGRTVGLGAGAVVVTVAVGRVDDLPPLGVAAWVLLGWAGAVFTTRARRRRAAAERRLDAARDDAGSRRDAELAAERRRLAAEIDGAVLRATRALRIDAARAGELVASDPDGARERLRGVAGATGDALRRLRRALALFDAEGAAGSPDRGAPDAAGATVGGDETTDGADPLATAVAELRSSGTDVVLDDDGTAADGATTLAGARVLRIVATGAWPVTRTTVRRDRHGVRIVAALTGPAGGAAGPALARIAERVRLHGGHVRVRRRPLARAGRRVVVVVPALGAPAGRWPGRAGAVAGLVAAAATAGDLTTAGDLASGAGDVGPVVGGLLAAGTAVVVGGAWTRGVVALVVLALLPPLRALAVGFEGLDDTTVPLAALGAFLPALWLTDRRARRTVAVAAGVGAVVLVGGSWMASRVAVTDLPVLAFPLVVAWLVGTAIQQRGREAERLVGLRWATEQEELVAAQQAVLDERRRVARDLHDLVGHGLALVSVQAWGAERALRGGDAERASTGVAAILRTADRTITELECLVQPPGRDEPPAVPPVGVLAREAGRAGLDVAVGGLGALDRVDPEIDALLRRVAREALTNVLRHAGLVATRVEVARDGRDVTLTVHNAPGSTGAPPGGRGLDGLRAELRRRDGGLEAGPQAGGGFAVRARVPAEVSPAAAGGSG